MSEIYSKYLTLNESKNVGKSPSKKSARKPLKEDRWEGYEEAKEVFYDAEVGEVWIDSVIEGDDTFTMYLEGDSEEDIEKAIDNVCNHYEKNAEKYPLVLGVDGDVEAGAITFFIEVGDEDLDESKKKVSLKNKKKLSEKSKKSFKKSLKEGEDKYWKAYEEAKKVIEDANVPEVYIDTILTNKDFFMVYIEGEVTENSVDKIIQQFNKNKEKYPLILKVREPVREGGVLSFFIKEEAYLKDIEESRRIKKFGKRMNEESEIKSYERTIKKIEKDLKDNGFEVVDSGVEKEKGFGTGGKDFAEYWGYVNLKYKIADENECRKIKDIISGYTFDNSEDNVNCFEGEKTIDIKMGNGSVDEACSKRRKRLSEKDSKTFNKAFNDFKNLVRDIAKEIGIDMYIDDIWTNSENEGKVIVDFDKKVPSQKAEALRKSLEDDIRVEKITKKDNGFVVIFKEKYRNLEESIKRKKLKESNSKRISFKQFKKLKESKMRKSLFSKRKLNESDSVTIEIDFDNYYECLRCIFKDANENLPRDQIYWYTELGMEFGVDPNSMYEWIKNEAELLSVDEIKEYKDLGDVSDEEAIDFAQERGYYMGEVNGDVYFLVPLGE